MPTTLPRIVLPSANRCSNVVHLDDYRGRVRPKASPGTPSVGPVVRFLAPRQRPSTQGRTSVSPMPPLDAA